MLTGRNVPPELVDTSVVRITSGYLTKQQVAAVIVRANVKAVLFASGRFDILPGFRAWVKSHYVQRATFGGDNALYAQGV